MAIGDGRESPNQARHDHVAEGREVGFFTDPTVCIGCKACEVACKEWNLVPDDGFEFTGDSYDNTGELGASSWRHVKFVEEDRAAGLQIAGTPLDEVAAAVAGEGPAGEGAPTSACASPGGGLEVHPEGHTPFRWLFLSDVCKHCEVAGCLDACPTGAIVRTETATVYVQDDVCNGCGYCVVACPFGVIDRRPEPLPGAGGAFKCTFCYDRQVDGLTPACAKVCPTEAIHFGPLEDVRQRAAIRVEELRGRGWEDAAVYDPTDTSVEGIHAVFLVPGDPERFGLPSRPQAPRAYLAGSWASALVTSAVLALGVVAAFGGL